MSQYQWATKNGEIITADYDRTKALSNEQVKNELKSAFDSFGRSVEVKNLGDDLQDVYKVMIQKKSDILEVYVCAKGTTPGGRSNLKNEQRIQPKAKNLNYTFKRQQQGKKAISLGIYKWDSEVVFCAWKLTSSNASPDNPISKQIKIDTIANALTEGFARQEKGQGEYVCAFRKEFIYFYLHNYDWLHNGYGSEVVEDEVSDLDLCNNSDKINLEDRFSRNRILFGAPGTGKSYKIEKDIETYNLKKSYERVTVHPNYTYAQFVGSYKPVSRPAINNSNNIEEKTVSYEFVPGPFLRILVRALYDSANSYVLVVEEINRANPAAVFGDIFQLLDRDSDGESTYRINVSEEMKKYFNEKEQELNKKLLINGNELYIPKNMYIWATMNSADQGVYPMDSAFKRRWSFEYIGINDNEQELIGKPYEYINLKNTSGGYTRYTWNTVRKTINEKLREIVQEDKLLGPFFLSKKELMLPTKEFDNVFKSKVLIYLFEDVLKYKKCDFFEDGVKTLSDVMSYYDQGKIFSFDFIVESEKQGDSSQGLTTTPPQEED